MAESAVQQQLEEALSAPERLHAENERLRALLALAQGTRAIVGAGSGDARPPSRRLDSGASAPEKVALIRSLFRGRGDVYALRRENARTGKSGYVPATAGGRTRTGPRRYLPLADEALVRHPQGRESIGIYPLLEDDSCWFLACDLEGGTWQLDALALFEACAERGSRPCSSGADLATSATRLPRADTASCSASGGSTAPCSPMGCDAEARRRPCSRAVSASAHASGSADRGRLAFEVDAGTRRLREGLAVRGEPLEVEGNLRAHLPLNFLYRRARRHAAGHVR